MPVLLAEIDGFLRKDLTMSLSTQMDTENENKATESEVKEAEAAENAAECKEEGDAAAPKKEEGVIMPFKYAEDEHYYIESLGKIKRKPFYSFVKRMFDFFASLIALLLLALPMLIVAIAIKIDSKGPVFYSQERLGLNGKKIKVVKFRTMVADAEKAGAQWSQGKSDSRITRFGSFLRKTRIDELPQLFGCLTGSMSLIGPRPEREVFYNKFEEHVHGFSERLKVKPGLTGLAQVSGGYDLRPEEKVLLDVEYIKKRSLWLDIKILFKTVGVIFSHKGAK